MEVSKQILEHYDAADIYLRDKRNLWSECESIFHNQLSDLVSLRTGNQLFDPKLPNLVLEREARVMAQLATGKVLGISKNDQGAAKLMNLTLDKYVNPNANSQFDLLTKYRMVDRYSNIYGNYFVLVDWVVRPNGYRGPDMWLLNIRDVFPQVGAVSLDDSERIVIRTWRNIEWFESLKKEDGYKNVDKIVNKLKEKVGSKPDRNSDQQSEREKKAYPDQSGGVKGRGYYEVLSMYEGDRWVDMCKDAGDLNDKAIFRDGDNPHDNGELPVVNKYSIPLLDDFMAFGDVERGAPMQYLINSSWNLWSQAMKISIFPPTIINKDNVADPNSFKYSAAAKWLGRGNVNNIAQPLTIAPQGMNTFNNVYQVATASLMAQFGTTSTNTTAETDPGFGKTPQALQMQAARENAKDSVDRFYMEQFISNVNRKFVNLIAKQKSNKIQFRMFEDEINALAQDYPEIAEMYDQKTGKLTVKGSKMSSILYDYEIVSGSTYAADQSQQQKNLVQLLQTLLNPQAFQLITQSLAQKNQILDISEIITMMIKNGGITDWDKIIVDKSKFEAQHPEVLLQQHQQLFEQALAQAQNVGGVPSGQPGMPDQSQLQGQLPAQPNAGITS